MNVCKVSDMCKDMEYKYITEDSKTRVYLSVVREFNEAEYEKYCISRRENRMGNGTICSKFAIGAIFERRS